MPCPRRLYEWLCNEVDIYQAEGWPEHCVEWPGKLKISSHRYGMLSHQVFGTNRVHIIAWTLSSGAKPTMVLDHQYDNPPCFNVTHLRDVSQGDNARRGQLKRLRTMRQRTTKGG